MGIKFISPFEKAKRKKEEKKRREEELRHIRKEEERKRKEQERKKDLRILLACLCAIVICFVVINVSDNGEMKKGSSNTTPAMTQENTVTDDSSSEEVEEILPQADDLEESGAESEEKYIDTDPDPKEDSIIDYSVDYNANEIIAAYNKAFPENPVTREEVTSYETGAGHGTTITHNGILITIGYADGEMAYHFAITGEASEGKWGTFLSQTSGWLPIVANMGTQQSMETILNKLYDDILSTGKNWASHSFEGSTYYDLNYMTLERNATESIHTSGNNWEEEEFAYLISYYE